MAHLIEKEMSLSFALKGKSYIAYLFYPCKMKGAKSW